MAFNVPFKGFKAFLPNIVVSLVRSGKARPPNEYVFRVPSFVNKFDIYQYLRGLYGLNITHITTTNFVARRAKLRRRSYPEKKTAVVRVKEELDAEGRAIPFWRWPSAVREDVPSAPYLQPVTFPKAH